MTKRRAQDEKVEEEMEEKAHMTMTGDRRAECWERNTCPKHGQQLRKKMKNVETGFGSFAVSYNFLPHFFQNPPAILG